MYNQMNPQMQQRMAMMKGFKPLTQQQVGTYTYRSKCKYVYAVIVHVCIDHMYVPALTSYIYLLFICMCLLFICMCLFIIYA